MQQSFGSSMLVLMAAALLLTACKHDVSCETCIGKNLPPVAKAGPDQQLTLPIDSVYLDGSASRDPDGTIVFYKWTKIGGPLSFSLLYQDSTKALLRSLVAGDYQFELMVSDNGGLSAKDTVQISVKDVPVDTSCSNKHEEVINVTCDNNRPTLSATLVPVGSLFQPRFALKAVAAGDKILFAGGLRNGRQTSIVDIFDLATQGWSTANLSAACTNMGATANGNKIFFAGGLAYDGATAVDAVDIFDVTTNQWSVKKLSLPGYDLSAAAVGTKVLFAGGTGGLYGISLRSNTVDIYDLSTDTWSTAPLCSEGKHGGHAAVTLDNKVYIAGGEAWQDWQTPGNYHTTNRIDVYDNVANTWSVQWLQQGRSGLAGVAVGNRILWAGGRAGRYTGGSTSSYHETCTVELQDVSTGANIVQSLSGPDHWADAVTVGGKALFFGSHYNSSANSFEYDTFDIFDTQTNQWSIGKLPFRICSAAIIAVKGTVYIAGGLLNDQSSTTVWKLQF